jgi:L-threonylcarbamoyladenylate synthase
MSEIKNAELINIDRKLDTAISKAKKFYLEGTVFIYPTDTIYGFGANPFNEDAVKRINHIKGRRDLKPYILLVDGIDTLVKYVEIKNEKHLDFLLAIWPNPVSVVLNLNKRTQSILNQNTAAFRIPNHRFCLKLLQQIKMPLISTSVNRSDMEPLTEMSIIKDTFLSEVEAIFYTEKKSFITVSTLIDLSDSNPVLIREGKIKFEDLLEKF